MKLDISYTLRIPSVALDAAETLALATHQLNAAGQPWEDGVTEGAPFTTCVAALKSTLAAMIDDAAPDGLATRFADAVCDELFANGEDVQYQITRVFGWTLVLVDAADVVVQHVPADAHPAKPFSLL